jgi:tripartite-type tricarboxylate transporter receptor subunit TctC
MTNRRFALTTVLAAFVFALGAWSAAGAADSYEGKTVRVIVAYSPGGGYDTYARYVGRHLHKHLPGAPRMIVENRPGAGGLLAGNYVYNSSRQDGTEILHIGGSSVIKQLTGIPQVKFDARRFQYIGATNVEATVLVVTKQSGIQGLDDVLGPKAREIALGGISTGSPNDVGALLLRDVLGAKVRLVTGYAGTSRIRLAMDGGEVDGMFNGYASLKATSHDKVQSGEYKILLQISPEPIKELGDMPTIAQLAKTDEQRRLIRLTTTVPYQFARAFLVGPQVPKERVAQLRKAFDATMADPAFLAEAKKGRLEVRPITGADLQSYVKEFLEMPPEEKKKVLGVVAGK